MAFDIVNLVKKAAKERIVKGVVPEDYAGVLKDKCITRREFNSCKKHCIQRIEHGWSFRDAWDIDLWLAGKLSGLVAELERNTHSYPDAALDLHKKCRDVDFLTNKDPVVKRRNGEDIVDYKMRVYSHDLQRMSFLFREYDKDRCSKQNQITPIFKYHTVPVKGKKGCVEMVDDCSPAEKRINERWRKKESELYKYRSDHHHIALNQSTMHQASMRDYDGIPNLQAIPDHRAQQPFTVSPRIRL